MCATCALHRERHLGDTTAQQHASNTARRREGGTARGLPFFLLYTYKSPLCEMSECCPTTPCLSGGGVPQANLDKSVQVADAMSKRCRSLPPCGSQQHVTHQTLESELSTRNDSLAFNVEGISTYQHEHGQARLSISPSHHRLPQRHRACRCSRSYRRAPAWRGAR